MNINMKEVKIYCYKRCSTCKAAYEYLKEKEQKGEIKLEYIEIVENIPSKDDMKNYASVYSKKNIEDITKEDIKKFFNTSGILYKNEGISKKWETLSFEEALKILVSDGKMIKRPLVLTYEEGSKLKDVFLGFKDKKYNI